MKVIYTRTMRVKDDGLGKAMEIGKGLAERAKVAVVDKTIGTVSPDKSTVMFKIFCTDEAALYKFIEGTEVSKPIMDAVLDSYSIYDLTKVK